MFVEELGVPADPYALARALADRPYLSWIGDAREPAVSHLVCDPEEESTELDPFAGAPARPSGSAPSWRAHSWISSSPRFVGVLPYEAFRGLERPRWSPVEDRPPVAFGEVHWFGYPASLRVDSANGAVFALGISKAAVLALADRVKAGLDREKQTALEGVRLSSFFDDSEADHIARIDRALELIRAGDLYQVNLARRLRVEVTRDRSCELFVDLYRALSQAAPSRFGAFLSARDGLVLSTSPELCLSGEPDQESTSFARLVTEPIKGTRPRETNPELDRLRAEELERSEKERAELTMIIDVERNDLHRVCRAGTVRLLDGPRVETFATVHHRLATVEGLVRPGTTRAEVLRAMLPSGSVTGAPKVRAMEVIRNLEPARRGLYTGAFGSISHGGRLDLSMAIRGLVFPRENGTVASSGIYWVGGGIVLDSSPAAEVAETVWKARQIEALVDGSR